MKIQLKSPADTARLGRILASSMLENGLFDILMKGALGCGKTTLSRAIVESLPGGDEAEISSPSFTVVNAYPTDPPVLHCDLYRSGDAPLPDDIADALDDPGTVVLMEWADYMRPEENPADFLALDFDMGPEQCENSRTLTLNASGPHAAMALEAAAAAWQEGR